MSTLPSDEIMSALSKIALEQATNHLAAQARQFAKTMPAGISGGEALQAFANAIESTNAKVWPKGTRT